MADEKKPEAPHPGPTFKHEDPFVEIVSWLVFLIVAITLLNALFSSITNSKLFSLGWNNLTPQNILLLHTRPISSLSNPIGARVVSIRDTNVYDSPGGKIIGIQKFGARGHILKGPVIINGERWWYVDYDNGTDGWVRESDIAALDSEPNLFERIIIWFLLHLWAIGIILLLFILLLIAGITYLIIKLKRFRAEQHALLYPVKEIEEVKNTNPQWERVVNYSESANENDWRLAVMEGDIMLSDLLETIGLPGDTMGDKLKAVDKSDFLTLDNAWEAHRIRNQVAHEGADFGLTQRETRRVVELYRSVFEEFKII
jgi:hypothetical protein